VVHKEQLGLPARRAAVRLLYQVLREGKSFDDLFDHDCEHGLLRSFALRDRALVRKLTATTLRRHGQLVDAIDRYLKKPFPKGSGAAREILLIGAVQLLFLDTPPHAAIDLAVRSADLDRKARGFKGVINAVLRRVSENADTILAQQDAVNLNTAPWLMQRWTRTYGADTARQIGEAHLHEPSLDITTKGPPEEWIEQLQATLLATGSLRLASAGRIADLPGFDDGAWWVQDAAAALPARLLGDTAGRSVLDMCAAPGGKTAQLASAGAIVTALDISAARLKLVRENLTRLGLEATVVDADASRFQPATPPQFILLDAPCSATGTIRRHPDIPHIKEEGVFAELVPLQRRMLDHAVSLLPTGGVLVFCTCSLEPEEGEQHIASLLADGAPVSRRPIDASEVGGLGELITSAGDLRTLPCHLMHGEAALGGLDGFFAARLVKH
jgi:16S rRNA (cytosine967-C5)-methyltransferase